MILIVGTSALLAGTAVKPLEGSWPFSAAMRITNPPGWRIKSLLALLSTTATKAGAGSPRSSSLRWPSDLAGTFSCT